MLYNGVLLCDKPYKISSHNVVNKLRTAVGQKKIGHTGTLDPRATGLLVICLGRATKISQFLSDWDKTYEAEITLGQQSSTYDSEGILDSVDCPVPDISEDDLENILSEFRGKIMQKVPAYSAVKVNGQRLYKLARKGIDVEPPEREIEINEIKLTAIDLPRIQIRVSCSKGTYIRTLAHEIGRKIGCGGFLSKLSRTRVGEFSLENALTINEVKYLQEAGSLKKHLIPIESILKYPVVKVGEEFSPYIISGRSPRLKDVIDINGDFDVDDFISLKDYSGRIMAVGKSLMKSDELKNNNDKNFFAYVRVLN